MFNGLIEAIGQVVNVEANSKGVCLHVATQLTRDFSLGDSVAVNGVCLTIVDKNKSGFKVDVSPETALVTTLGKITVGTVVNLEGSLRVNGRLGGHFVLGHVDDVGHINKIDQESEFYRLSIGYPEKLKSLIVEKGSIAVDGASLTVVEVGLNNFEVQIIPYTWKHTNFNDVQIGTLVNIECDIIGKYVAKAMPKIF